MRKANKSLCPDCGVEAIEHSETEVYRYKGEAYIYDSHYWRCVNGHEFQTGEQMQKSLYQCDSIKKAVDKAETI